MTNSSNIIGFPTSKRTTDERIKAIQKRLEHMGILDVKVTFAPDAFEQPLEQIKASVADFMEAYLIGKSTSVISDIHVKYLEGEELREALGDPPLGDTGTTDI